MEKSVPEEKLEILSRVWGSDGSQMGMARHGSSEVIIQSGGTIIGKLRSLCRVAGALLLGSVIFWDDRLKTVVKAASGLGKATKTLRNKGRGSLRHRL